MAQFDQLPPEILDEIATYYLADDNDLEEQNPLTLYSAHYQHGKELVSLSQVCQALRGNFLPLLWRRVSIFYLRDLDRLNRFFEHCHPLPYARYVKHFMFSWFDPEINKFQAELEPEVWMGESALGKAQNWAFQDRARWYQDVWRSEIQHNNPDWTLAEVEKVAEEEPHDPPWTLGPDGTGPIPGMDSIEDATLAFEALAVKFAGITHFEFNATMFPLPMYLIARAHQLRSLTIFADSSAGADILSSQQQIEELGLIYDLKSIQPGEPVKVDVPYLSYTPISPSNPLGVAFDLHPKIDSEDFRLKSICQSIFQGVCGSRTLKHLKLVAWGLLRVDKMLPLLLSLDSINFPQDDIGPTHHWDWQWGPEHATLCRPIIELRQLKGRLQSCRTLDDLNKICRSIAGEEPTSNAVCASQQLRYTPKEIADLSRRLSQQRFASWICEDQQLAVRVLQAINL